MTLLGLRVTLGLGESPMHAASFKIPARKAFDGERGRAIGWKAVCGPQFALLLLLSGCGSFLEDNGTHLAYALEEGAARLRASNSHDLLVQYETLDGAHDPYYIEITPSFGPGETSNVPGSYMVVSGVTRGGTSYHNRFLLVPQRLYIEKSHGGPTYLVLRKEGDGTVSVVELR